MSKFDHLITAIDTCRKYDMSDRDIFEVLRIGNIIYKQGDGLLYEDVARAIDPSGILWNELVNPQEAIATFKG